MLSSVSFSFSLSVGKKKLATHNLNAENVAAETFAISNYVRLCRAVIFELSRYVFILTQSRLRNCLQLENTGNDSYSSSLRYLEQLLRFSHTIKYTKDL